MFCIKCGKELKDEYEFCPSCGHGHSKKIDTMEFKISGEKQINNRKVLIYMIIVFLCGILMTVVTTYAIGRVNSDKKGIDNVEYVTAMSDDDIESEIIRYEGEGFDTPQEAVKAYLNAFKNQEVDEMLSTFAIETYVERFNLALYIERLGLYKTGLDMQLLPNNSSFAEDVNRMERCRTLTYGMYRQYLVISESQIEYLDNGMIALSEMNGGAEGFVEDLGKCGDWVKIRNMEIGGFYTLELLGENVADAYRSETNINNKEKYRKAIGADELESVAIEVIVNEQRYIFFMETARYGNKWFNLDFSGNLGSMMGVMSSYAGFMLEE